ncbi:MAG: 30S ribosomal protein S7 [Candidatus Aenigmatarchaeota archaeon]
MSEDIKLFDRWDLSKVEVDDPGLKDYISVDPVLVPNKSHGRHAANQFHKSDVNIVERLINKLQNPGHRGKKHKISSGMCGGNVETATKIVKKTLEIVEDKLDKNPVKVLVDAIENSALMEEVSSYQIGSIIARKAVITSPQRRVDLSLRHMVQGAYSQSLSSNKNMEDCLAKEVLAAYNDSNDSFAIRQKDKSEREAAGAR